MGFVFKNRLLEAFHPLAQPKSAETKQRVSFFLATKSTDQTPQVNRRPWRFCFLEIPIYKVSLAMHLLTPVAHVAELADAYDSGSYGVTRGGSSPLVSTILFRISKKSG